MMSLAVMGAINQSNSVPIRFCGSMRGSMQVYAGVYVGLCGSTWVYTGVYMGHTQIYAGANDVIGCGGDINQSDFVGLHRSMQGSMSGFMWVYSGVYAGLHGSTLGPMSLAVAGTLTNQILWVYVGLCGSMWGSIQVYAGVYMGLHGGLCGSMWGSMQGSMQVYVGVYTGL